MRLPAAEPYQPLHLLDPCAGDGAALLGLRSAWSEHQSSPSCLHPLGCELEGQRARALAQAMPRYEQAFHGDAFHLHWSEPTIDVLYLNPPYDQDPVYRRSELRFLERFTPAVAPGTGALLLLVPVGVLPVLAEHLAVHYADHQVYRLPDEHYEPYGQVLVMARRRFTEACDPEAEAAICFWADDPEDLPVLPEVCPKPLVLAPPDAQGDDYRSPGLSLLPLDMTSLLERYRPWQDEPVGTQVDARRLLGAQFHTATPPKPAHIALALSAGMFNGIQLRPNDSARHPVVLAKGVFHRRRVEIGVKHDSKGEVVGSIEVEVPHLQVHLLRLDTYRYLTLADGVVPVGGDDLERWNVADLLTGYDRSFARLLHQQFPPLHNPADPDQLLELPSSPRTPYRVQHHAISTALKLIAKGQNPFLVAEVGTGKSTMGLFVAHALSPQNRPRTARQLEEQGFDGSRLPTVRRTLILCPPHLLKSWSDQVAAVMPGARVQILRQPSDVELEADIYVLSREAAKLGSRIEGVEGRCPGCGHELETDASTNRRRRLRCDRRAHRPLDVVARLAVQLSQELTAAGFGHPLATQYHGCRRLEARQVPGLDLSIVRHLVLLAMGHLKKTFDGALAAALDDTLERPDIEVKPLVRLLSALAIACSLDAVPTLLETFARYYLGELKAAKGVPYYGFSNALQHCRLQADKLGQTLSHADALLQRSELHAALEQLVAVGQFDDRVCGEPLYTATAQPRRYPLAKYIARYHRRRFGLSIIDECHEYNNTRSAQTHAVHRLVGLPGMVTVVLTGSLMGGYASSLFPNFYALSPRFREEFGRGELPRFTRQYGYSKLLVTHTRSESSQQRGVLSDREMGSAQRLGEAPGVLPTFLMQHLLPTSVLVHKEDLDEALPPITEDPVPLCCYQESLDAALLAEYQSLRDTLLAEIRANQFGPMANALFGTLVELPSYLDRATEDQGAFELRYPERWGGSTIATGMPFPETYRTPKERWLLSSLEHRLAVGENVLVFLRHTGDGLLPRRLLRLIEQDVTYSCRWLDTKKVPTAKREAWIDRHINEPEIRVLLVNADAVRTGLNNLVRFTTGIWYELPWSATTVRQGNGRLHRIGQTRPVTIKVPYYEATAQETAFDLVARKISASLQVDGLDIQAALEAAGASEEASASASTAMALGEAVYRAMVAEAG